MTEDAFARRFYADRAELDALGIHLRVDKPADGFSEQENYSLAPEAFHLPAIAFTDAERAALQTALTLLDGEFAYAEPLRLALQQITWGRPSPLGSDSRQTIGLGITASAGGARAVGAAGEDRHRDLPPQADRVRVLHDADRRDRAAQGRPVPPAVRGRPVLPRRLLARARRRARVPALAHPRQGRLLDQGRARLPAPGRLRPARVTRTASRGSSATRVGTARDLGVRHDRLVRRAPVRRLRRADATPRTAAASSAPTYAIPRLLVAWALRFGEHARVARPARARRGGARRGSTAIIERHRGEPHLGRPPAPPPAPAAAEADEPTARSRGGDAASARSASRGWSRSPRC